VHICAIQRIVTPAANNKTSSPSIGKNSDARRNLYVLGLPFDLTKCAYFYSSHLSCSRVTRPEFSTLFSRFGTVMHAVILATVDNASRRRGFVVMSSHEEAKRAMNALSRTQMKYRAFASRFKAQLTDTSQRTHP
jgi:RNA recognition motif-containing protein